MQHSCTMSVPCVGAGYQQCEVILQVADFFAHLVKRFSPKSYTQALAEVKITQRFLENFSGDSVHSPVASSLPLPPPSRLPCPQLQDFQFLEAVEGRQRADSPSATLPCLSPQRSPCFNPSVRTAAQVADFPLSNLNPTQPPPSLPAPALPPPCLHAKKARKHRLALHVRYLHLTPYTLPFFWIGSKSFFATDHQYSIGNVLTMLIGNVLTMLTAIRTM